MNMSRSEGKRVLPSFTLGRWLFIISGFILFLIVSFVLYVRSADSDYRRAENEAIRIGKAQGELVNVFEAVRHTWQGNVWIVTGEDAGGERWTVFELENEIVRKKASENLTEEQMLAKFAAAHTGKPIRIMPAWFNGQPAWEIRYRNEGDERLQSLDFYSFEDGSLIRTYVLSNL
ncbi:hypothetical protein [Cohnella phaseoli]|uniref:DUF5590 domain-containing protein n=1 Tax=Cohnella phaseoli TaxID=456490 RepID=A0A3D9IAC8_9BACL|nr:hypothetical protein [Cohnella phaseoli]RED58734.1 hypothetical protein DFP98_13383 [Cohnella phaseoli]